jgi:hypothetical protein
LSDLIRLVSPAMLKTPTKMDLVKIPSRDGPEVSLFKKICPFVGCSKTFKVRIDSVRIRHSYLKAHLDQHLKGWKPPPNEQSNKQSSYMAEDTEEESYQCFIDDDENDEGNDSDNTNARSEELTEESEFSRVLRKMTQLDKVIPTSMRKPKAANDLQKLYSSDESGISHYVRVCPVIGCVRKFKMRVDSTRIRFDYFKTHLDQHLVSAPKANTTTSRTASLRSKHSEDQILFYVPSKQPTTGIKIERVDSFHDMNGAASGSSTVRIKLEPSEAKSTVRESKCTQYLDKIYCNKFQYSLF